MTKPKMVFYVACYLFMHSTSVSFPFIYLTFLWFHAFPTQGHFFWCAKVCRISAESVPNSFFLFSGVFLFVPNLCRMCGLCVYIDVFVLCQCISDVPNRCRICAEFVLVDFVCARPFITQWLGKGQCVDSWVF